MRNWQWLLVLVPLLAEPAGARTATADAAFVEGRFAEAAVLGRKEATAQSLLLACRAQAIGAAYELRDADEAGALLARAVDSCDAALKLSPGKPEAVLHRGLAVGYQAKLAQSPGQAKEARRAFEAAVAKMPKDATALAAMGGWHGEAVATLGKFVAGTVLGAKEREAIAWFERAMAAEGADPVVPVFYASTLLNLSAGNAPRARALLERSQKAPARDGFERLVKANGAAILKPLAAGDVAGARATAARLSPLGMVG